MSEPEKEQDWMIAKVDQRIALMKEGGAFDIATEEKPLIFSFLDEGDHEMTGEELARWERTCDRCGKYVPDIGTETFYTGHIAPDHRRQAGHPRLRYLWYLQEQPERNTRCMTCRTTSWPTCWPSPGTD